MGVRLSFLLVSEGTWGFSEGHTLVGTPTRPSPSGLCWVPRGCIRTEEDSLAPRDLSSTSPTYTASRVRTTQFLVLEGEDSWATESQT